MQHTKPHAQHFLRFEQMADIRPAVMPARRALASLLDRLFVKFKFLVKEIQFAVVRIYMAMPPITAGIYAVKEVYAALYAL